MISNTIKIYFFNFMTTSCCDFRTKKKKKVWAYIYINPWTLNSYICNHEFRNKFMALPLLILYSWPNRNEKYLKIPILSYHFVKVE